MTTEEIHELKRRLSTVELEVKTLKWMVKWTSKFISIPPLISDQLEIVIKSLEQCQLQLRDQIDPLSNPSQTEHGSNHLEIESSRLVPFETVETVHGPCRKQPLDRSRGSS